MFDLINNIQIGPICLCYMKRRNKNCKTRNEECAAYGFVEERKTGLVIVSYRGRKVPNISVPKNNPAIV